MTQPTLSAAIRPARRTARRYSGQSRITLPGTDARRAAGAGMGTGGSSVTAYDARGDACSAKRSFGAYALAAVPRRSPWCRSSPRPSGEASGRHFSVLSTHLAADPRASRKPGDRCRSDLSGERAARPGDELAPADRAISSGYGRRYGAFGSRKRDLKEVSDIRLCLLTADMQNRRIINQHFAEAGAVPKPTLESNSMIRALFPRRTGRWASIMLITSQIIRLSRGHTMIPIVDPDVRHTVGLVATYREPFTAARLRAVARGAYPR